VQSKYARLLGSGGITNKYVTFRSADYKLRQLQVFSYFCMSRRWKGVEKINQGMNGISVD
jgi:hypothetical protein